MPLRKKKKKKKKKKILLTGEMSTLEPSPKSNHRTVIMGGERYIGALREQEQIIQAQQGR